jgi:exosortase/archaeosortase family protein
LPQVSHKLRTQIVFVLFVILVTIVKNGIRIVTLSLLAIYVDPGFLYGRLHRSGGFVFFLMGALLLLPLLWALRRGETLHIANARSPS